ncbi:hypothetical protein TcWFU_002393 [Taenia crassiceps]|uniref:Uncharacterized protein n=1 Tax=Taenia crassiceps TaxID=6207 RepID=A0ABR4QAI2_9CEST
MEGSRNLLLLTSAFLVINIWSYPGVNIVKAGTTKVDGNVTAADQSANAGDGKVGTNKNIVDDRDDNKSRIDDKKNGADDKDAEDENDAHDGNNRGYIKDDSEKSGDDKDSHDKGKDSEVLEEGNDNFDLHSHGAIDKEDDDHKANPGKANVGVNSEDNGEDGDDDDDEKEDHDNGDGDGIVIPKDGSQEVKEKN